MCLIYLCVDLFLSASAISGELWQPRESAVVFYTLAVASTRAKTDASWPAYCFILRTYDTTTEEFGADSYKT